MCMTEPSSPLNGHRVGYLRSCMRLRRFWSHYVEEFIVRSYSEVALKMRPAVRLQHHRRRHHLRRSRTVDQSAAPVVSCDSWCNTSLVECRVDCALVHCSLCDTRSSRHRAPRVASRGSCCVAARLLRHGDAAPSRSPCSVTPPWRLRAASARLRRTCFVVPLLFGRGVVHPGRYGKAARLHRPYHLTQRSNRVPAV